jgi:hypothetical protein
MERLRARNILDQERGERSRIERGLKKNKMLSALYCMKVPLAN